MPGTPLDGLKRDCRANTFSSLNFASEQNRLPEDRYFYFFEIHKDLSDHKATLTENNTPKYYIRESKMTRFILFDVAIFSQDSF